MAEWLERGVEVVDGVEGSFVVVGGVGDMSGGGKGGGRMRARRGL